MSKRRHTAEEIVNKLRQADVELAKGQTIAGACKLIGITDQTYFRWRREYGGLVGSTVPCEGSRTGFYTDDFNEQDFKSPEEIRKACLCGANLLGAKVEGTDFYLVDLRRALFIPSRKPNIFPKAERFWFRACAEDAFYGLRAIGCFLRYAAF